MPTRIKPYRVGYGDPPTPAEGIDGYFCEGIDRPCIDQMDGDTNKFECLPKEVRSLVTDVPYEELEDIADDLDIQEELKSCNTHFDPLNQGIFIDLYNAFRRTGLDSYLNYDCKYPYTRNSRRTSLGSGQSEEPGGGGSEESDFPIPAESTLQVVYDPGYMDPIIVPFYALGDGTADCCEDDGSSSSGDSSEEESSEEISSAEESSEEISSAEESSEEDSEESADEESAEGDEEGSSKDHAIVPAPWLGDDKYVALFVEEQPEVIFSDWFECEVGIREAIIPHDPRFFAVCEPGTVRVTGLVPDRPCMFGAVVDYEKCSIVLRTGTFTGKRKFVGRLSGVRRGFEGLRMPEKSQEEFKLNEAWLDKGGQ